MAIREFPVGGLSVLVDAVGQETKRFGCYSLSEADTNYAAATSVAGNTVQEQIEQAYDTAGNVTRVNTCTDCTSFSGLTSGLAHPAPDLPRAPGAARPWPGVGALCR